MDAGDKSSSLLGWVDALEPEPRKRSLSPSSQKIVMSQTQRLKEAAKSEDTGVYNVAATLSVEETIERVRDIEKARFMGERESLLQQIAHLQEVASTSSSRNNSLYQENAKLRETLRKLRGGR